MFTVDRRYAGDDTGLAVVRGNDVSISCFADTSHPGQTALSGHARTDTSARQN